MAGPRGEETAKTPRRQETESQVNTDQAGEAFSLSMLIVILLFFVPSWLGKWARLAFLASLRLGGWLVNSLAGFHADRSASS
jgi:hypothetical protein